jgi:hypothetical protein
MNAARETYPVIRVSQLDEKDVLKELEATITERGYAWFGKYGRPIRAIPLSEKSTVRLVLVQGHYRKGVASYDARTFKVLGFSRLVPEDRAFPAYYRKFLSRIRSWIRVEHLPPWEQKSIDELLVTSSNLPHRESFRNSMSSHFVCRVGR